MSETVTISLTEYRLLKKAFDVLEWLEGNGVDNWSNYSLPPDRDDYDTDDEYQEAYQEALESSW